MVVLFCKKLPKYHERDESAYDDNTDKAFNK